MPHPLPPAEWPTASDRANPHLRPGLRWRSGAKRHAASKHVYTLGDATRRLEEEYAYGSGVQAVVEAWLLRLREAAMLDRGFDGFEGYEGHEDGPYPDSDGGRGGWVDPRDLLRVR